MKKSLFATLFAVILFSNNTFAQLSATTSQTNPTCTPNTGSASVSPSGGSNYAYKWNTGASTSSISSLNAGTYTVTVYSQGGSTGYRYDTLYLETFQENNPNWTINTPTGTNATEANFWTISNIAGYDGTGQCTDNNAGQNTLFITSNSDVQLFPGCTYYAGGEGDATTNTASESPTIEISSAHNLLIQFDFTAGGDNFDKASLLYRLNGTSNFVSLAGNLKTDNSNPNCVVYDELVGELTDPDGEFQQASYSLPNSITVGDSVQIQFNWTNNNDDNGTDPSIAVTNVMIVDSIPTGGSVTDSIVKTVTLVNDTLATPGISPTSAKICASDSSHICVSGSYASYVWNTVNQGYPGDTTQCIYAYDAGDYYVSVSNGTGCSATSNHANITVYPSPSVSITVQGDTLVSFGQVGYQWFMNGAPINGATKSVYIATTPGSYAVQVTDTNNCKTLSSYVTTAVQNLSYDAGFEIFPNPATGNSLELSVNTECMGCEIKMYDVEGRLVYVGKVTGQKQSIDISELAKGAYMLSVSGAVKKFIKE